MFEEQPQRDEVLLATGEFGNVLGNRIVEVDLPLVVEDHERGRCTNDLGERREVVKALGGIDSGAFLRPVEPAEAALPYGGPFAPDDHSGVAARLDPAHDDVIDLRQSRSGHADGARGFDGQTVATTSTGATSGER